jgi:hypothetical protein
VKEREEIAGRWRRVRTFWSFTKDPEIEYQVSGKRGSKFLLFAYSSKKFRNFFPFSCVQYPLGFVV